jgi:hypothetical protein
MAHAASTNSSGLIPQWLEEDLHEMEERIQMPLLQKTAGGRRPPPRRCSNALERRA